MVSALFRAASTSSFDKLYRQHAASIYRYTRAVLGNHADAEDVTQQIFLNAYRALSRGTKPRKTENWLFTIAHNEVRRHLRDTRGKRLEVELDEELAQPAPERSEPSVTDVLRALQHLTPNQRSALVMREFEGRSYAEIAAIMGLSQAALETLVFRARRGLAEVLEDGLTCAEAELAVSRRLDGRLSRREARRLKRHMRECRLCTGFEGRQRRQRSLLQGLSVIPVPASLFVFRGESAAAAGGMAAGAAATGGSVGIAAKAAAVAAAVSVAGGVGYTAGADLPLVRDSGAGPTVKAAPERSAAPNRIASAKTDASARPTAAPSRAGLRQATQQPKTAKAKKTKSKPAKVRAVLPAESIEAAKGNRTGPPLKRAKAVKELQLVKEPRVPNGRSQEKRATARPRRDPPPTRGKATQPTRPERPPQAQKDERVKPTPTKPAPIAPPGQEKQLLDPKPDKAAKTDEPA
jgi:RNA polymerase sigma factor (sigma-70 family)